MQENVQKKKIHTVYKMEQASMIRDATTPIVLYTNLFTLEHHNKTKNKYIDMFYIWLMYVVKFAALKEGDICVMLIDEVTFAHLSTNSILPFLCQRIPQCKIIHYPQPKHIKDGMLERFNLHRYMDLSQSLNIYLDIDVLVIQNIRHMITEHVTDQITTFYLKPEGELLHTNYYGELASEEDKTLIVSVCPTMTGFTSGIFAWKNAKDVNEFFSMIVERAKATSQEYYTVDQPYFNAAVFQYVFKKPDVCRFQLLSPHSVGHNLFSTQVQPHTILLNFCGIPGDDDFHWNKILNQLIITSLH